MPCDSNVDKILHREIYIAKNKLGCCFFVAKSESGRVLLKALYNFCEYYDNYQKAKQNNMQKTCRKPSKNCRKLCSKPVEKKQKIVENSQNFK